MKFLLGLTWKLLFSGEGKLTFGWGEPKFGGGVYWGGFFQVGKGGILPHPP